MMNQIKQSLNNLGEVAVLGTKCYDPEGVKSNNFLAHLSMSKQKFRIFLLFKLCSYNCSCLKGQGHVM